MPCWSHSKLWNVHNSVQLGQGVTQRKMLHLPDQLPELLRPQHLHTMRNQLQPHSAGPQRSVDHRLLASHSHQSNCSSPAQQISAHWHSCRQQRDLPRPDFKHSASLLPHNQLQRLHGSLHRPHEAKQPRSLVQHPVRAELAVLVRPGVQLRLFGHHSCFRVQGAAEFQVRELLHACRYDSVRDWQHQVD